MLTKNFWIMLLSIIALLVLKFTSCETSPVVENWEMGKMTYRPIFSVKDKNGGMRAVDVNTSLLTRAPDSIFYKNANFQSLISPRTFSGQYPSYIRYNMPAQANQAVPCSPLEGSGVRVRNGNNNNNGSVVENYPTSCGSGSCGAGSCPAKCGTGGSGFSYSGGKGQDAPPDFAAGNYNEVMNQVYEETPQSSENNFPLGTMAMMDTQGNIEEPVVYTNFIYANQQSRLRGRGDPIRGDLPIAPCNRGWFTPSAVPSLDLQQGALNVIGGFYNEQGRSISNFVNTASGGADTTLGGVNLAQVNTSPNFDTSSNAIFRNVNVSMVPSA